MKIYTIILPLFFVFNLGRSNAQTSLFDQGFSVGFKKGYCYTSSSNNTVFCYPPLPPLPPLPQLSERSNSYNDGYNRGFLVGRSRRDSDDSKELSTNSNSGVTKFNPYVPQLPILRITPEQMEAYSAARAARNQALAEAIANLVTAIFTVTPEQKSRIATLKKQREQELAQKKLDLAAKKEAKRLIVGSDKYLKFQRKRSSWLRASIFSSLVGGVSYLQANIYNNKYKSATNDAARYRISGNVLYTITSVCLATTTFSLVEFSSKANKLKNAKSNKITFNSKIGYKNISGGLFLEFN